jgi:hypothetical protein
MSAKWIRSKQWDDQHIPAWAWPAKFILRAFSSIPLAVVLLSLVALYCVMASVPVGLLVLGATYGVYGLTLLLALLAGAVLPVGIMRLAWRPLSPGRRAARFAVTVVGLVALAAISAELWYLLAWPRLHYDPAYGTGLRLFAGFIQQYESTTLRRLPGLEMSELEFYSWWPLRVVLTLFVINMIVATVRRIEFTLPNLGVLTVHTGIVIIALGSMYYGALKQEGDTLLFAGEPGPDGHPSIGAPQSGFYDNTRVVLWIRHDEGFWEQRPIHVPRYNDYNLGAGASETALAKVGRDDHTLHDRGRTLDRPVPSPPDGHKQVDPSLRFRIVGYASYAEPVKDHARAEVRPGTRPRPVRFVELFAAHEHQGRPSSFPFYFIPDEPAHRLAETDVFAFEYLGRMAEQRFDDLTAEFPEGTRHALVVEVPGQDGGGHRGIYPASPGVQTPIGNTGYTIEVQDLMARPPFPIITPGYQGAESSIAIVRITSPAGESFERWVYHRYPEISQDMLEGMTPDGRQMRRAADASIRISYIDASKLQIYIDEPETEQTGKLRAIVRQPGAATPRVEQVSTGGQLADIIPGLHVRFGARWAHSEEVERPRIVPPQSRRSDEVGNHMKAMLAVEVTSYQLCPGCGYPLKDLPSPGQCPECGAAFDNEAGERVWADDLEQSPHGEWSRIVWLPFTKYLGIGLGTEREVQLPGGRRLHLAFGRLRYPLPFMVQLMDFQMVAYDHRGAPRDYQSLVRVMPHQFADVPVGPIQLAVEAVTGPFQPFEHITKLNAPLQAPFMWSEQRSWTGNTGGLLLSRLNPQQFKFSQAGWDADGWQQTQARADRGELPRPYAQFTILGVGNNPGIHIIALGSILMSIGIPWAFYIKPWMMQQRKRRIQAQVAAGTFRKPAATPAAPTTATSGAGA